MLLFVTLADGYSSLEVKIIKGSLIIIKVSLRIIKASLIIKHSLNQFAYVLHLFTSL